MFSAIRVVPFGAKEAGCFREVAVLHRNHPRQVPLYYIKLMNPIIDS